MHSRFGALDILGPHGCPRAGMIARQARNNPAQEAVYKTRHLNIWVTGNQALFAMDDWAACKVEGLRREDFAGRSCILGLDDAGRDDRFLDDRGDDPRMLRQLRGPGRDV